MTGRTFTTKDLQHLSGLANLQLTSEEIKQLTADLNQVFTYFKVIDNLDIKKLPVTSSIGQETNITRNDQPTEPLDGKIATGQTKRKYKNYFVVDSIF